MMIFFDSYAIIEVIKGASNYEKYNETTFITNTLNLSEVFYSLIREVGERIGEEIINKLNFEFVEISEEIALKASKFKYKNKKLKLSYADCIGYITALENNMKFLTGDKEFEKFKGVEFVGKSEEE